MKFLEKYPEFDLHPGSVFDVQKVKDAIDKLSWCECIGTEPFHDFVRCYKIRLKKELGIDE